MATVRLTQEKSANEGEEHKNARNLLLKWKGGFTVGAAGNKALPWHTCAGGEAPETFIHSFDTAPSAKIKRTKEEVLYLKGGGGGTGFLFKAISGNWKRGEKRKLDQAWGGRKAYEKIKQNYPREESLTETFNDRQTGRR